MSMQEWDDAWKEYTPLDPQAQAREDEKDQRHIDRTEGLSTPETRDDRVAAAWARLDAWLDRQSPTQPRFPQTQEHEHDRGA